MPDNIQRSRGRPQNYKFDRGGSPAESGPYIGRVKNNIDPTRSGRLQVYIEQFAGLDENDPSLWRTVSYIPPWYGATPHTGTNQGSGTFKGNPQSYGMWFTPPDLGVSVICFFVGGDPNQGYYTGCIPDIGISHMIPAIGASNAYSLQNTVQSAYFSGASQLPVTEINDQNLEIVDDPRFFEQQKPVHSFLAGVLLQQGLITDTVRGPITSNSQRETPSSAFGLITPGRAIYQGGLDEIDIQQKLDAGEITPEQIRVDARRGGHSLVMDDGDLVGQDNLVRIRTAKGHQITMSDDGDCFYIIHANGQTWLEFGVEGTVDVFATNSVNIRTQGEINLHADQAINMYAGTEINIKTKDIKVEATADMSLISSNRTTIYSKTLVGIKSDGTLNCQSASGAWDGGSSLSLLGGTINLNSGGGATVDTPASLLDFQLPDVKFVVDVGWVVEEGVLKSIVTRAPTHEPYPYHNQGVDVQVSLSAPPPPPPNPVVQPSLDSIQDTPVQNAVTSGDVLTQPPADLPVGTIDTAQVQASLAQTAKDVNQPATAVSADKGVGKYGISAQQLETAGFIKPGTVGTYLKNPANLQSVLSSPAVWTGKKNVDNLDQLLGDPKLQSITQNQVMASTLTSLKQAGAVSGQEIPQNLASLVTLGSKFGVGNAVSWVQGQAPADLVSSMNSVAKNAQFSVNLSDKLAALDPGIRSPIAGFSATVDRSQINQAFAGILGDPKIPVPSFAPVPPPSAGLPDLGAMTAAAAPIKTFVSRAIGAATSTAQAAAQRLRNQPIADISRSDQQT